MIVGANDTELLNAILRQVALLSDGQSGMRQDITRLDSTISQLDGKIDDFMGGVADTITAAIDGALRSFGNRANGLTSEV